MTEHPADVPPDLTTGDVARRLQVHPRTVIRMCKRGEFPGAYRLAGPHGFWRVPPAAVESFIHSRRVGTESEG